MNRLKVWLAEKPFETVSVCRPKVSGSFFYNGPS